MKNLKVKIIVGYRRDQEHSIPAEEAHKAYFLFLNPEARSVFSTGLAIKGDQIQEIVPDYQGTMGWSPTHVLDNDDWNELHRLGVPDTIRKQLGVASQVAQIGDIKDLPLSLTEVVQKYPQLESLAVDRREGGMKKIQAKN